MKNIKSMVSKNKIIEIDNNQNAIDIIIKGIQEGLKWFYLWFLSRKLRFQFTKYIILNIFLINKEFLQIDEKNIVE